MTVKTPIPTRLRGITRIDVAFAALVVMVVVEVTGLSLVLDGILPMPVFRSTLALGVLAMGLLLTDPVARRRMDRWVGLGAALLALYLVTEVIGALGSVDPAASRAELWRSVVDVGFVFVALALARMCARPWAAAAAVVVPMAAVSLLTVVSAVVFHGTTTFGGLATITDASGELVTTARYGGPYPDSNFWGRNLAMAMPLAWALLARAGSVGRRAWWLVICAALLAGAYMTQSRGTMLTIVAAIVIWLIAAGMAARLLWLVPVLVGALLAPGVGDRLVALVADVTGGNAGVDPSVLGRKAAQEIAWTMFAERPMFGWGPGTFVDAVDTLAGRMPTLVHEVIKAPHNLYVQLAAETGVVGLLGWLVAIGGFVVVLAMRLAAGAGRDRAMVAALLTGIIAWSLASAFLHLAYFRAFGMVLALACALFGDRPPGHAAVRLLAARGARLALVGGAAALVGTAVFVGSGTSAVTASQTFTLLPVGPAGGYQSYALDVRSREEFLPTVAEVLNAGAAKVTADAMRGTVTISATAPDAAAARAALAAATDRARLRARELIGPDQYQPARLTEPRVAPTTVRPDWATSVAVLAAAGAAVLAALAVAPTRRRTGPKSGPVPAPADSAPAVAAPASRAPQLQEVGS